MTEAPRDANGIVWQVRDGDCLVCRAPLAVWEVPAGMHPDCEVNRGRK